LVSNQLVKSSTPAFTANASPGKACPQNSSSGQHAGVARQRLVLGVVAKADGPEDRRAETAAAQAIIFGERPGGGELVVDRPEPAVTGHDVIGVLVEDSGKEVVGDTPFLEPVLDVVGRPRQPRVPLVDITGGRRVVTPGGVLELIGLGGIGLFVGGHRNGNPAQGENSCQGCRSTDDLDDARLHGRADSTGHHVRKRS
jgi:hypothetical protein